MVFLYRSTDGHLIFMGKNRFENEVLLECGFQEDIVFCLDCRSNSSYLYLRLDKGEVWTSLNKELIMECSQLIKQNIEIGKERDKVNIIYTPYSNLYKTKEMKPGNAELFNKFLKLTVKKVLKDKEVIKQFMKNKTEEKTSYFVDLSVRYQNMRRMERFNESKQLKMIKQIKEEQIRQLKLDQKNYSFFFKIPMTSNKSSRIDEFDNFI